MAADQQQRLTEQQLTEQQRRAIAARRVSVALSAGAGCGKTFVLTERFLAQLQPHDGPEARRPQLAQLVAITFTERAAREMRDRIRAACSRRLLDAPAEGIAEEIDYWHALIRELDTARISTIHSFCGSLLRAHAVEAQLDPRFRVLDQAQADTLLYELLEAELRDRLTDRDDDVIGLLVQFGLGRLHEMIRELLGRRQEIDWPQWRQQTPEQLTAVWANHWHSVMLPRLLDQIANSPAAREVLEISQQSPSSNATMRQRCDLLSEQIPNLAGGADPKADLASIGENAKVQGGGGKKAWESEEIYNRFRDACERLRKAMKELMPLVAFDAQAAQPAADTALRLLAVTAQVAEAYDAQKQQFGFLDFDDLLIRAGQLLVGPDRAALRSRISAQIRLLLVDEFQDTDPLQVELVKALCGDELQRGKLFFVGDFKQSIYRFRGADPHVYQGLRSAMLPEGRLPLSLNFRSQPAVLDFVNALFCDTMGPEYEPLRPHRPQVTSTPAVEFLWPTQAAEDNVEGSSENPVGGDSSGQAERLRRLEADWIARRIRAMLDLPEKIVWDEEADTSAAPAARAVRPGDVALLFRALSNVQYYEEALRRWGIDYYLVGGHAFYAQQEIYDVLNLLRSLESPCDEVSLAGVLRSPMFSLLDETLFWLAQHPDGLSGGLLFRPLPEDLDVDQRCRVEFAAATLTELRAMKDRLPIAALIGEAMARTGYDAILLAEFLGERKLANLKKLIEQARTFDRSGVFTLADFIIQLSQFVAQEPKEPLAATHGESTDVVRLMTVHQSKGLEFPVVIVPDLDRRTRGPTSPVAFTRELGPMVKHPDAASGFEMHALAEKDEQQVELVRLLYVATTRAADYLILSAAVPQLDSAKGPWMDLIARRFDLLTGRLRSTAGDLAVNVTTIRPEPASNSSGARARRSLRRIAEKARQMAASGAGRIPQHIAPIEPDPGARRQYSFSRLSGALHRHDAAHRGDPLADDAQGESPTLDPLGLDPLGLGTLVHAVLAEVPLLTPDDVPALVRRHAEQHLPDAPDRLDEPIDLVQRFLASPRAAEIAAAEEVYPELEFLLTWPPSGNQPSSSESTGNASDGRYLQGFIDCLYRDAADRWHLIDYKTNRVTAATIDAVAADYQMQMLLYALAVERILGRPPDELALCFLRPGLEYPFAWNDTARQHVIEMVSRTL